MVDKIIKLFEDPFAIAGEALPVTVSVGVATFPYSGEDNETLVSRAYASLRKAAGQSGNTYDVAPYEENRGSRRLL